MISLPRLSFLILIALLVFSAFIIRHKVFLLGYLEEFSLVPTLSSATLSEEHQKLILTFDLTDKEKEDAENFSRALNISPKWLDGIALELDPSSFEKLNIAFPLKVNVDFSQNNLKLSSKNNKLLSSSLPRNEYNFATSSGKLSFKVLSDREFDLEIIDPYPLALYATSSGELTLSSKIGESILPILSKIGTIKLKVTGSNINGEILLK
jgi:hypothetical protein